MFNELQDCQLKVFARCKGTEARDIIEKNNIKISKLDYKPEFKLNHSDLEYANFVGCLIEFTTIQDLDKFVKLFAPGKYYYLEEIKKELKEKFPELFI